MPRQLIWAAIVGLLATQALVVSAQASNKGGFVSGHPEGMPPISGQLCVTYSNHTECKSFSSGGPNDISISIPPNAVQQAGFTVLIQSGNTLVPTVDSLSGQPCGPTIANPNGMPLSGQAGMALCQSTAHTQVHRFNAIWNTNSMGNGTPGVCASGVCQRP